MINAAVDTPGSPALTASSTQPTRAPSPEPPSLPYLFYHDFDSALTTPPPLTNLHSLLRTFTPPLLPPSPYQPHTLASLFAALDQPYGFECVLSVNNTQQYTYFIPFLSAIFLYSQPTSTHPTPHLLFSHTDSLPPHTRYPLPYQIHHLLQHQPVFAGLLNIPLAELGAKSWLSLYWTPVLVDLHHEHVLAGYFIAYYQIEVNKSSGAGSGSRMGIVGSARERLEAAGSTVVGGRNMATQEGETEAEGEGEESGRREGESEGGEESKENLKLNGSVHSHTTDDEDEGEDDGGEGMNENAADEGAMPSPPPLKMDDAHLLLIGYVGCKVDESTWYGDGGQLEGDESAVTDTFTAYRLTNGGVDSRVTHVDVENELYDLLNSDGLVHPDYLHAVQHTKAR